MPYSLKDILQRFKGSRRTLTRRLTELKKSGKFIKRSPGYFYTEIEVKKISKLLEFSFFSKKQKKK